MSECGLSYKSFWTRHLSVCVSVIRPQETQKKKSNVTRWRERCAGQFATPSDTCPKTEEVTWTLSTHAAWDKIRNSFLVEIHKAIIRECSAVLNLHACMCGGRTGVTKEEGYVKTTSVHCANVCCVTALGKAMVSLGERWMLCLRFLTLAYVCLRLLTRAGGSASTE